MKRKIINIIAKFKLVEIFSFPLCVLRLFPIKANRVLFINYKGKAYGDSLKYIAEELRGDKSLDLRWAIRKKRDDSFPIEVCTVRMMTPKYFYMLATSKVIIINTHIDLYFTKRKGQKLIQVWHGGLALKKIEFDAPQDLSDYYIREIKKDAKQTDYMVSNSKFCTDMYRRAFRFNGDIKEFGTPRNDCLINDAEKLAKKARKKLKLSEDKKIILYAPTFRSSYGYNPYDIDFDKLIKALKKITGLEWIALIKLHPLVDDKYDEFFKKSQNMINVSKYPDMQELICASDLVVTDYSSVMFEAMIAKKPVYLYAKDIEKYGKQRGYYFRFNELPFELTKNNDELIKAVSKRNLKEVTRDYLTFEQRVGLKETGKAAIATKELIEKIVSEVN